MNPRPGRAGARRAVALATCLVAGLAPGLAAGALAARAHPPAVAAHGAPPPPAAPAPPRPVDSVRDEYEAAIAPGLADTTEARLERLLLLHPHTPWTSSAQLELGQLHYARGDYAAAREHFRRARGGPALEEASYWEALSAFALGKPREARDAVAPLARARRGAPREWDAGYLVALTWAQEGQRPEALAAYRALLTLPAGSGEAAALYQAETLARELKENAEADAWSRRLLTNYPDSPEAASVRADMKRAEAAAQAAREAAEGGAGPGAPGAGGATAPAPAAPARPPARGGR